MLNITGIGNLKQLFHEYFLELGIPNKIVDYNLFKNSNLEGIVFYDGLMIDLGMELVRQCKNSIVVFGDIKSIYVSGTLLDFSQRSISTKNYVCGECSLRNMKNQIFQLSLYDTLSSQTDYKSVGEEFSSEYRHLASILKDRLYTDGTTLLEYNLHTSLYKETAISGLTGCRLCDKNSYSQSVILDELSFLFSEGVSNDI